MKPRLHSTALAISSLLLLFGCNVTSDSGGDGSGSDPLQAISNPHVVPLLGYSANHKLVYVPTYSHIYTQDGSREFDLAVTLSVRNSDPDTHITLSRVNYFDSAGNMIRSYVDESILLAPLASRSFIVAESDRTGGVGANFIVEWSALETVSDPVVEAVMISTASNQGISFVSRGIVVRPIVLE